MRLSWSLLFALIVPSVLSSFVSTKNKCEECESKYKVKEECTTSTTRSECHMEYDIGVEMISRKECKQVDEKICVKVPQEDCEEGGELECSLVFSDSCQIVPSMKCEDVEDKVEKKVPREVCEVCTKIKCVQASSEVCKDECQGISEETNLNTAYPISTETSTAQSTTSTVSTTVTTLTSPTTILFETEQVSEDGKLISLPPISTTVITSTSTATSSKTTMSTTTTLKTTTPSSTSTITTATSSVCGDSFCFCLNLSDDCSKCEVDCLSECNDLTMEDGKCFSEVACQPSLLFESECEQVSEDGKSASILTTPLSTTSLTLTSLTSASSSINSPVCGGDKICVCMTKDDDCSKCEIDCLSDCNDLTEKDGKCFSELACHPAILFESEEETCHEINGDEEKSDQQMHSKSAQTDTTSTTTSPQCLDNICLCLIHSDDCSKCEVGCFSDCYDLTKEDGKCFSKVACQPSLLFETGCK